MPTHQSQHHSIVLSKSWTEKGKKKLLESQVSEYINGIKSRKKYWNWHSSEDKAERKGKRLGKVPQSQTAWD